MIDGTQIGTKDKKNDSVTVERLISEISIPFRDTTLCVYIDNTELLKRTKYNWFCRLSPKQVLNSNTSIGTLLLQS